MRVDARIGVASLLAFAASACSGPQRALDAQLEAAGKAPPARAGAKLLQGRHLGPGVVAGAEGTKRFVDPLYHEFDLQNALAVTAFVDGYYRAPANDGFEASLEHVAAALKAAGFGQEGGLELAWLECPLTGRGSAPGSTVDTQAWTPVSGRIALTNSAGDERVLHSFEKPADRDRTMLPINAPSCDVEGLVALSLSECAPGKVLVIEAEPGSSVLARAQEAGAVAVLSAYLERYNEDPSGKFRHLDAVQFRQLRSGQELPVAMISLRSLSVIKSAVDADPHTRLRFQAQVKLDARPLRTLSATVVGADRPSEAVAIVSHVQEPGACDNASGVGGLCESACALVRAMKSGKIARPSRSLVFLWGDEMRQSSVWLEATKLTPVAGLSSDMTGESKEKTGAIALLERMPDPGAIEPLEPDQHTPWGRAEVDAASLTPNGLALVARCALLDVAELDGGWDTADHPYEGGSDHDVFIARGIPAALVWHFTDFAYHTSLDRMEHVDASEMRRTGVALLATALALADPRPADLDRYLRSLNEEENVRVAAADKASKPELAEQWRQWCDGARQWLRVQCLRIPESESKGTK